MSKTGRRSKIHDEDTVNRIIAAVEAGAIFEDASQAAGVSKQTFFNWRNRGEAQDALDEDERDPEEAPFLEFFYRVKKADATAMVSANVSIKKAWTGQHVKKEVIVELTDGTRQITREYYAPDWHAGAWFAERRRNDAFGRREIIKHAGDSNEPVVVKVIDSEMMSAPWLNYKEGEADAGDPNSKK